MTELPLIESCDGCGACCMTQCAPPFAYELEPDDPSHALYRDMPAEARALIDARHERYRRGERVRDDDPCVWLDLETKRCRFYEFRPEICREFEMGSEDCHEWRKDVA